MTPSCCWHPSFPGTAYCHTDTELNDQMSTNLKKSSFTKGHVIAVVLDEIHIQGYCTAGTRTHQETISGHSQVANIWAPLKQMQVADISESVGTF